jgi:hypothetical protein
MKRKEEFKVEMRERGIGDEKQRRVDGNLMQ